jgi:hypothetical protein
MNTDINIKPTMRSQARHMAPNANQSKSSGTRCRMLWIMTTLPDEWVEEVAEALWSDYGWNHTRSWKQARRDDAGKKFRFHAETVLYAVLPLIVEGLAREWQVPADVAEATLIELRRTPSPSPWV